MHAVTGQKLGERYRIVHPISRGGMGAVFEAEDEKLGRRVAVKVLLDELAQDPTCTARFRREARAIAAVTHPGLVALHDLSLDGSPAYLVMELVDGPSVAELLAKEGRLAWPRAVRIVADVLDALAALHEAGIVHRDLKPANVLCANERGHEQAKVIDLGVAQLASGAAYQRLTTTGAIVGTPAYMAPEQLAGDPVGPAADVWAAGVLLYTCVSGQRPFASADLPQLLGALHLSEPTPLATIAPDVPPEVAAIIGELLQKPPGARPRARDVADRLRRVSASSWSKPLETAAQSPRSVSGAVGPAPSPLAQVAPLPAPGERTRAFRGSARVGRLAAALAGLGVLTTCAVGLALAGLFVAWRESPTLASTPAPATRSVRVLYRGVDGTEVGRVLGPTLDPVLARCIPDPNAHALGETAIFLVHLDREGAPNRVETSMSMSSATTAEETCMDAALRAARWPVPSVPFAMSTVAISII